MFRTRSERVEGKPVRQWGKTFHAFSVIFKPLEGRRAAIIEGAKLPKKLISHGRATEHALPSHVVDFLRILTSASFVIKGLVGDYFHTRVALGVLFAGFKDRKELADLILELFSDT